MKGWKISHEHLKSVLNYDPQTGVFTWKVNAGRWGRIPAGTITGNVSKGHGYAQINISGKVFRAHILAWLYMTGEYPKIEIDHINRVRHDNRFANLRESNPKQNTKNKGAYVNNTSGFAGVTWHKRLEKWQARIGGDCVRRHLGYYENKDDASAAYAAAKRVIHKLHLEV
jgi:hypothetical protein